jgi:hypothetical protein
VGWLGQAHAFDGGHTRSAGRRGYLDADKLDSLPTQVNAVTQPCSLEMDEIKAITGFTVRNESPDSSQVS